MLAVNYSDDIDYATQRLQNTVVRNSLGKLVIVTAIFRENEVLHCQLEFISSGEQQTAPLESLDVSPVPLGFVTCGDLDSVFITRKPLRKPQQGLTFAHIHFSKHTHGQFRWSHLEQSVYNTYPTMTEAENLLCGKAGCVAFAREWAVLKTSVSAETEIFYRHWPVGKVKDSVVTLHTNKLFLSETLEEAKCR